MAQKNFNGTGFQNFAVAGNWTPNGVPGSSDDAEIASGAIVSSAADEVVNSIGLGSNNVLNIQNASFTTENGTGANENNGIIDLSNSDFLIAGGTFDNPGTIELTGTRSNVLTAQKVILDGGGTIAMSIGGGLFSNSIGNGNVGLGDPGIPTLVNADNTISGDGSIGAGLTSPTTAPSRPTTAPAAMAERSTLPLMQYFPPVIFSITARFAPTTAVTLIFGSTSFGSAQVFANDGTIEAESSGDPTKLEIAGNVTIADTGAGGSINLGGSAAQSGDEIVTSGNAASLTIIGRTLQGLGNREESLTIDNLSGTIDADVSGQELLGGSPGTPLFTNGGTLEATIGGILLAVDSPIANSGTIAALSGGSVVLGTVLSTGAIDIGAGSSVSLSSEVVGNITFIGDGAELIIEDALANGGIDGKILGAGTTNSIDISSAATAYAASNHLSWQQTSASGGVLSLINSSGQTLETLDFAGTFATANFTMASDGNQGTLIEVGNLPPLQNSGNGDFEVYDISNNQITNAVAMGQVGRTLGGGRFRRLLRPPRRNRRHADA